MPRRNTNDVSMGEFQSDFDHQCQREQGLCLAEVGRPAGPDRARRSHVTSGSGLSSWTAEVGHVRVPVVEFESEDHERARDVIPGELQVPGLELISRVVREVRRSREGRRSVDGGYQYQVAARIVDGAAHEGEGEAIPVEPDTVIGHEAQKVLPGAADTAAIFAAGVERERRSRLADGPIRVAVILEHDAVVRMEPLAVRISERVGAEEVLVAENGEVSVRAPQDLRADAGSVVELAVGLPSVDEPRLDLELFGR